jgi:hypothetical protein
MRPKGVSRGNWLAYNMFFLLEHVLGETTYAKLLGDSERKLMKAIDSGLAAKGYHDEDFKVIEHAEGEWPEPYCHPYFPVVFRGIAKTWPCHDKWGFDFFSGKHGDSPVTLINNAGLVKDTDQAYDVLPFREYIARLRQGSKQYLKFSRIVDEESSLREDFDYQWLRKFRPRFALNDTFYFFMGGKGTATPIHDGFAITVFVQVEGTKRWLFYPCNQRLFLGARPRRFNYFYSEGDPEVLDDPKYPLMKYAAPIEVVINPGDVLYFPSLVWHQVENVNDSIGVAYKFASVIDGFISSKMLATCFFLATKPWLIETMMPWRGDTYNYKKSGI